MPLRFAPSRIRTKTSISRFFGTDRARRPANDNARPIGDMMHDPQILRATLLHFARHGLASAEVARSQAEASILRGDETTCRHWLAVCRQLDRRMAKRLEQQLPLDPA